MADDRVHGEFAEFVQARSEALRRAAFLMIADASLAQDLVQEALIKTYAAWSRLRHTGNAEAYARKAITTTALSWFRRKSWESEQAVAEVPERSHQWPSATSGAASDAAGRVHDQLALGALLLSLPPRQRIAVTLRFYLDLTEGQTAEAMGCSVGTVKSQVHAALAKLRIYVDNDPEFHRSSKATEL